jgi:hypothetical protein
MAMSEWKAVAHQKKKQKADSLDDEDITNQADSKKIKLSTIVFTPQLAVET